ncbi:MAG TPA: PAS domain-containing methyl-accepting chemotaxis protein [Methanoregulaceae archaeon]|nr:PAS domain-containing methyl-accepting chemotaxis protein [Methanoregulaceae archaeon]
MKKVDIEDARISFDHGNYDVKIDESSVTKTCTKFSSMIDDLFEKCNQLDKRADTMMEQNPLPILVFDQNFSILATNEAYAKVSGIPREKLLTMNAREFKILSQKGEGLKDVIKNKKRSYGEISLEFPVGFRILEQYGIPILDGQGELVNLFVVYNDVTELRNKMVALEDLQKRSEAIVEENPYPILVVATNMDIENVNKAFLELTGYSANEVKKLSLKDFKYLKSSGGRLEDTLKNKKKTHGMATIEFPSGIRIVKWHYLPLLDHEGNVANLVTVYNDVTEEKKNLDDIKELQQRSNAIVDENPYPIVLVDPQMNITTVNKAFLTTSGYSKDRLSSLTLKDFKYLKSVGGKMEDTLKNRQSVTGVATIEFPSGKHILEWHYIPLLDKKGDVSNVLIVYNDITEKKLLEERLQKSISELAASLVAVSQGDLTQPAVTYPDDPLAKVKADLNTAIDELGTTLNNILQQANQLEHAVVDVGKGADEIAKASQQVALTAQKTSDDVRTQIIELEKVTKEVSDLSASIEEIASTSQEVKSVTGNVAKEGNEAVRVGNEANSKMKIVQEISQKAVDEIDTLNEKMREISNIVKLITDIANQTNLLALNAAIEAARAGEHGRGFAVVAGEVRNLAGESKNATRGIEDVIGGITVSSKNTAEAMKKAYEEIISGIVSVNETIDALNRMVADVNISANSIADISRATEDQAGATNNVTKNVDHINNLILGAEKSMEDLAALAEESSASTEEVASASNEIRGMAIHLREMVDKFKIQ